MADSEAKLVIQIEDDGTLPPNGPTPPPPLPQPQQAGPTPPPQQQQPQQQQAAPTPPPLPQQPQPSRGTQPPPPAMEDFFTRMEKLLTEIKTGREDAESGARGQRALLGVGQGLGMAGMPAAGAVVSGFAGGAGGGAATALTVASQKLSEVSGMMFESSSAILSMDPWRVARGFSKLAEQIPVFGGVLGKVTGGILSMLDGLESSARRLAGFNPQLAQQMAQIDVARIQRDINRAQTMGPQLAQGVQAKFELETLIQNFIDQIAPDLIKFLKDTTPLIEATLSLGFELFEFVKPLIEIITQGLTNIINLIRSFTGTGETLRQIRDNTSTFGQDTASIPGVDTLVAAIDQIPGRNIVDFQGGQGRGVVPGFGVP